MSRILSWDQGCVFFLVKSSSKARHARDVPPRETGTISSQSRFPRRRPPQRRDPRPRLTRARAPHTHGHEFLARRGMYRDARIQVGLRASHLHGHAEPLHHLVGAHPEDVHPHDLLVDARAHQLHQRLGFVLRFHIEYPVVEVAEFGRVHSDVAASVLFDRPGLGQAARADGLEKTFARAKYDGGGVHHPPARSYDAAGRSFWQCISNADYQ